MKVSPLTHSRNVELVKSITVNHLRSLYKRLFNYDLSYIFKKTKRVDIYECTETGYRFYWPYSIAGDSKFYEELEKFDWYYMDWKWEHKIALKHIQPKSKVLEIGCGHGSFLKVLVSKLKCDCTGLELNKNLIKSNKNKFTIKNEDIVIHSQRNIAKYNVVCSFQVMEHISDIGNVIKASLRALKPNGLLIISVPNNESSIVNDRNNALNMPPHHMGLWNSDSLINIQKIFPINLIKLYKEPLQKYHHRSYVNFLAEQIIKRGGKIGRLLKKSISPFLLMYTWTFSSFIEGHTIIAVYARNRS